MRDIGSEVLAVVPARGGSKSIPRKNLMLVGGEPLIARTVRAARGAAGVTRVIVTSDDEEILQVATSAGAERHRRPEPLASDEASSESALLEVLETLEVREGYVPDILVFLQCTSPFSAGHDVERALRTFHDEGADSLLSVCDFGGFVWRRDGDGNLFGVNHDKRVRLRRQERDPEFVENGAIYVMRVDGFLKTGHRFFGKTVPYVMDRRTALELDELQDLEALELLMPDAQRSATSGT